MSGKILSIKGSGVNATTSPTDMSVFSLGLWTNKYMLMLSIPSYSTFHFLVPKSLMPHLISSLFDSISWLNPSDVGDKQC